MFKNFTFEHDVHPLLKRNLCIFYCCIIWIIYTPISIYGIYKFYKYRTNIVLRKRHYMISIHLLLCLLILSSFCIPLMIITYNIYSLYPMLIILLQIIVLFVWRQCMYYFDVSFVKNISNKKEWTQLLLHSMPFQQNNSIKLEKCTRISSNVYFYKIMFLTFCVIFTSIAIWILFFSFSDLRLYVLTFSLFSFWSCLCFVLLIILRCKTPLFDDAFYVFEEMKIWIFVIMISALIIICDLFIDFFVNSNKFHIGISLTNYFIISTAACLIVCISSHFILHKHKEIVINHPMNENKVKAPSISFKANNNASIKDQTILDVLIDEALFDQFIRHLMRELSMEIILSLIEFHQFQQSVHEFACFIDADTQWDVTFNFFVYPSFVPKSSIVFDDLQSDEIALCQHLGLQSVSNEENDAWKQEIAIKKIEYLIRSHKLYAKYIKIGAKLQISLTKKTQKTLFDAMDEFDKWVNTKDVNGDQLFVLFGLFEKAMEEMYTLLNCSFMRFKQSEYDYQTPFFF